MTDSRDPSGGQWDAINRHLVTARLASATVHDARNTLQTISGMAELISMRRPGDKQLDDRVNAIQQLCLDLGERLDAYRSVQAERPPALGRVDVAALAARAIELRATSWGRLRIASVNAVPAGTVVNADAPGLLRILLNLVLNAERSLIDAGGGDLTISANEEAGEVTIVVDDSGGGVTTAEEPHLFQLQRADGTVATGLWTSSRLAELSGGSLTWLGPTGRRAAFALRLPSGR